MYKKLLFFLLLPVLGISQVQIGQDIDGKAAGDLSGYSVSLSSDGSIVAIGEFYSDGIVGSDLGRVRIYENVSGSWVQIGQDIVGDFPSDWAGYSISLSSDGSIVAIGAPWGDGIGSKSGFAKVYKNASGAWTQVGKTIDGEAAHDYNGMSVSLSADGSIVAISTPGNDGNGGNSGQVRVYENISGVWTQTGNDIDGNIYDKLGSSVSLSADGSIVAIGTHQGKVQGLNYGHVRVYENISGVWTQIGSDIDGKTIIDNFGYSVSLSSDGSIVAIGAPGNDNNGSDSGQVRVYENISGVWTQIGSDIDGEAAGDMSGYSVSLSDDGSIVAIGAPNNDGNGSDSGHVRVYENISGVWTQIGSNIDGEGGQDYSGWSVSLSADGSILGIGAPFNNDNGIESGHVRIYNLKTSSENKFVLENFNIYPNPTSGILNINLENNLTLEKVTVYNNSGQIVKTTQKSTIDVSSLSSGVYFVEITTNQGIATKKVIVK